MKILVIDDDALVAKTLARLLRAHEVHILATAKDALEPIFRGEYDLIFCDLMMPGLSGSELYEIVSEHDNRMANRFVFVTGGAYTPASRDFVDASARPILHKPFDKYKLKLMLDSMAS